MGNTDFKVQVQGGRDSAECWPDKHADLSLAPRIHVKSRVEWQRLVVSATPSLEVEIGSSQKCTGQLACLSGKVLGR